MRTLSEIIDLAKGNENADYDELKYAVCALEGLLSFAGRGLRRSSMREFEEHFRRMKNALNMSPKKYLGPEYDPESPDYQKRRKLALKLLDKFVEKSPTPPGERKGGEG